MNHRFTRSLAALAGVLLVAGCGSSESSSKEAPAEDKDQAELESAVQSYSDAFLTGDVKAYDMLSERCQKKHDKNYFIGILMAANSQYGSTLPLKTFEAEIEGDRAEVSYTYDLKALDQELELWVLEGPDWKQDGCQ